MLSLKGMIIRCSLIILESGKLCVDLWYGRFSYPIIDNKSTVFWNALRTFLKSPPPPKSSSSIIFNLSLSSTLSTTAGAGVTSKKNAAKPIIKFAATCGSLRIASYNLDIAHPAAKVLTLNEYIKPVGIKSLLFTFLFFNDRTKPPRDEEVGHGTTSVIVVLGIPCLSTVGSHAKENDKAVDEGFSKKGVHPII
ncbi:hypothetical protein Tco_0605683 [Tanacetum coccineum]